MSASENACQKLFTDLYFDHVICLCNSSCSLWGLCILFFFNRVSYRLNQIDSSFFFTLFLFSDKFWCAQAWKHSLWLKSGGINLKVCSYPVLTYWKLLVSNGDVGGQSCRNVKFSELYLCMCTTLPSSLPAVNLFYHLNFLNSFCV